jgi:hypothetical protein
MIQRERQSAVCWPLRLSLTPRPQPNQKRVPSISSWQSNEKRSRMKWSAQRSTYPRDSRALARRQIKSPMHARVALPPGFQNTHYQGRPTAPPPNYCAKFPLLSPHPAFFATALASVSRRYATRLCNIASISLNLSVPLIPEEFASLCEIGKGAEQRPIPVEHRNKLQRFKLIYQVVQVGGLN